VSAIQLFRVRNGRVSEVDGQVATLERHLQRFLEANLESLFGMRFVATEYGTGKEHKGRIDTLGLDENGCPVIVEYKRTSDEVVVTQGLYYLDWLADHHGDFEVLVRDRLGERVAAEIDWENLRLVCVAEEYTKFDEHAVRQIPRNIDLVRYVKFGEDLFLVELVHRHAAQPARAQRPRAPAGQLAVVDQRGRGISTRLDTASTQLRRLFMSVAQSLEDLGDDVTIRRPKLYWSFSRLKNFACVELQRSKVLVHLSLNPRSVRLVPGFTRDMVGVGHFGTGDVEVALRTAADLERAKPLFRRAYEGR